METVHDEINLFEVIQPLIDHWKLLFLGVLAGILIAVFLTFVTQKQYGTSVLLQVGAVLDKQLEDSNTVVEIINSDSFHQTIATRLKLDASPRQLGKMIQAETNLTRPSPLVTVTVVSDSPQGAVNLANAVFAVINERHKPMYDGKMAYYIQYGKVLEDKVNAYENDIKNQLMDLNSLGTKGDLSARILLQARMADRENQSLTIRKELRELLAYQSGVHSHATAMVAPPVLPSRPSKPSLRLNLLVAFLVSLFAMISFIFVMDQYKKASLRI
jgi:capsular polysaccharide biosynthesis protein